MNRIVLASAALLGLAGAAFAQQAPELQGNYSANVLNSFNDRSEQGATFVGGANIDGSRIVRTDSGVDTANPAVLQSDNYSR